MTHLARLILVLAVLLGFAPLGDGGVARASGNCGGQVTAMEFCPVPGGTSAPVQLSVKSCAICLVTPEPEIPAPVQRLGLAEPGQALPAFIDRAATLSPWRPPRA